MWTWENARIFDRVLLKPITFVALIGSIYYLFVWQKTSFIVSLVIFFVTGIVSFFINKKYLRIELQKEQQAEAEAEAERKVSSRKKSKKRAGSGTGK